MKVLFVISFVLGIGFSTTNSDSFSYNSYVDDAAVVEMLTVQFVKNIDSEELISKLEGYMSNHIDQIDYVTGHYAKETDMFYYTIYGSKDGQSKFDLIGVDKTKFESESYYDYDSAASLNNLCRRGNGYPLPPVCPGTDCQNWPLGGCLGIICPRVECY